MLVQKILHKVDSIAETHQGGGELMHAFFVNEETQKYFLAANATKTAIETF